MAKHGGQPADDLNHGSSMPGMPWHCGFMPKHPFLRATVVAAPPQFDFE